MELEVKRNGLWFLSILEEQLAGERLPTIGPMSRISVGVIRQRHLKFRL